jgi:uncharacterized protein (TIRG00374 family)
MATKRGRSILTRAVLWSILVGLAVSVAIVWGVGFNQVLDAFHHAGWPVIAAYLGVSVLIAIGLTVRWRVILDAYGVRLPFYTLFIYRLIGFSVGYFTPSAHVGGEPVRALLLQKQGIPLKIGFSSAVADKSLELLFNVAMFFLGTLVIASATGFALVARVSLVILGLVAVGLAAIFLYHVFRRKRLVVPVLRFFRVHRLRNWPRVQRTADEVEGLLTHFYTRKNRHFRRAVLINAILWVLMFVEYKFALLILGYDASLFSILVFLTGVGIAYAIPIPAALGVLELGQLSAGALLGVAPAIGVALAFVVRVRDIIWTLIGAVLLAMFHLNAFNLYARSVVAARRYNFERFSLELRR